MWSYEKRLQYPIHITTPNAKMASYIISQYGGPDGELGASMRYLSQRFSAYNPRVAGLLTDIGTEELAHLEMIGAIVRQLTKGLSAKELEAAGFAPYYIDHTAAVLAAGSRRCAIQCNRISVYGRCHRRSCGGYGGGTESKKNV